MNTALISAVVAIGLALAAYAALLPPYANPDYNPARSHHRPDGFANRHAGRLPKPDIWRWTYERWRDGLPKPPAQAIPSVTPDLAFLHRNTTQTTVTWLGHATVLLQIDGLNILTDPHWGERASPFSFIGPRRYQPVSLALADLPPIHAVLISHNHWDHLEKASVRQLLQTHPAIRFYVPLGVHYWMQEHVPGAIIAGEGQNVFALDWDDSLQLAGKTAPVEFRFLSVQHWSGRWLHDRYRTLWGSWAVLHPDFRFWFSGDIAYSRDTQEIGQQLGPFDLAAISIGAYAPRWFMKNAHLDPAEAIQVMRDIGARSAFGIHWGCFDGISDEALDQPPIDLEQELATTPGARPAFFLLKNGQTHRFSKAERLSSQFTHSSTHP